MKTTTETAVCLGIDIAKATFDACLQLPQGRWQRGSFANHPEGFAQLTHWLQTSGISPARVGLEATGPYWLALAHYLHSQRLPVCVLNPAYVKAHGQSRGSRTKTDRADARLIADYLATHRCEVWEPLPAELEELRELMRFYADVTGLAASAAQRGEGLRTGPAQQLQAELAQVLEEFAQKVLQRAREQARQHETLERTFQQLDSIPGIAQITALILTSELPRGRSARTVAGWAGVTPRQEESGTSVHRAPRLCKQGSEQVRRSLYWPAITALRCSPPMQAFARRLEAAGLNKMQIVGAAMHKLLRWSVGVMNSGKMFDPTLHAT